MNELLTDEKLTTADLINPPAAAAGAYDPGVSEFPASLPSSLSADDVVDARNPRAVAGVSHAGQANPLFPSDELETFRSHWNKVQSSFVDEPRAAVEQADNLVANVVKRIAEQFASEREQLEKQWDSGDDADTENLRQAIKRYRAFFDRLLAL